MEGFARKQLRVFIEALVGCGPQVERGRGGVELLEFCAPATPPQAEEVGGRVVSLVLQGGELRAQLWKVQVCAPVCVHMAADGVHAGRNSCAFLC